MKTRSWLILPSSVGPSLAAFVAAYYGSIVLRIPPSLLVAFFVITTFAVALAVVYGQVQARLRLRQLKALEKLAPKAVPPVGLLQGAVRTRSSGSASAAGWSAPAWSGSGSRRGRRSR